MRPILLEIGPLSLWFYLALASALFAAACVGAVRESRTERSSPAPALLLYAVIFAGVIAAALRFREVLAQPLPIRAYGTMLMLAFLAGIAWTSRDAKRRGIDPAHVLDLSFFLIIASVVFARVLFVLLDLSAYRSSPGAALRIWEGGLSFHGGLIGAILALAVFARVRRLGFWRMADLLAPGAALGYGIARIGCFLNGCCYGEPSNLPWAVTFLGVDGPRHPTQIYASLINFAIFGLLLLWRRRPMRDGQLVMVYLGLYSVYRFGIEFLRRGASARLWLGGLTEAQIASLAIVAIAAVICALIPRWMPARDLVPDTNESRAPSP